jgi:hypothetical protein
VNKIICPKCLKENNEDRLVCWECGTELNNKSISSDKQTSQNGSESVNTQLPISSRNTPSSHKRYSSGLASLRFGTKYHALEGIAGVCNTIATIFAVIAGIGVFFGFVLLFRDGILGFGVMVAAGLFGVSGYIGYKLIAEAISVILDIEMNTRQTAAYTKLLVENRQE